MTSIPSSAATQPSAASALPPTSSIAPVDLENTPVPEGYERRVVDLWEDNDDDDDTASRRAPNLQYVLVRFPEYDNFTSVGFESDNYRVIQQNLLEFRRLRDTKPVMVVYQPPTKPSATPTSSPSSSSVTPATSSNHPERGAPYAIYRGRWHTKTTPFTNQTNLVVAQTFEGSTKVTSDGNINSRVAMSMGAKRGRDDDEKKSEDHRTVTAGYPISAIMTLDRVPL